MSEELQPGNWYVLFWNLKIDADLHLAPGLTLRPLNAPLAIWDLAAAGAVGFREWATLEPFASGIHCELETAKDAAVLPGYDTLNRAWLVSSLLLLRGFGRSLPIATSAYTWQSIAGHQKRTKEVFHQQLAEEGVDAAVHSSHRELPPFTGFLLDYHLQILRCPSADEEELGELDADWIRVHFDKFNELASLSERFRFALEASNDWRYRRFLGYGLVLNPFSESHRNSCFDCRSWLHRFFTHEDLNAGNASTASKSCTASAPKPFMAMIFPRSISGRDWTPPSVCSATCSLRGSLMVGQFHRKITNRRSFRKATES